MFNKRTFLILSAALLLWSTFARLTAKEIRVRLLETAAVDSDWITLANLLPQSAPDSLRDRAAQVSLGKSPLPGTPRVFQKAALEHLLRKQPDLLSAIEIPERITLSRAHRMLSREEIRDKVVAVLKQHGLTEAELPSADDLQAALVSVTKSDPGLVIQRIDFDPVQEVTKIRLWASKEAKSLPFYVTARLSGEIPVLLARHSLAQGQVAKLDDFEWRKRKQGLDLKHSQITPEQLAGLTARRPIAAGEPVTADMFQARPEVTPGKPATMLTEGQGFRIMTTVVPL